MPHYPTSKVNVMRYPSPSGQVTISKYTPPFEPVEEGFGFKGILMEDFKSGAIQCHICSNFFHNFNSHLRKHGITSNQYREMFGLSRSTALKSKKVRLRQSQVMTELRKQKKFQNSFKKNNGFAGNRKNKKNSAETKNKFGVCDLQIADRVLKLKQKLGKTPTLIDLKDEYGGAFIFHIHKRYGSYIKYCKQLELTPRFSSHNPKYSEEYFVEKGLSNEPSIRILTSNESRAFYKYFKSVKEWRKLVEKVKAELEK
jgi:hypothetical protein